MNEQKFTWFPKITRTYNMIEDDSHKLLFIRAVIEYGTYGIEPDLPYPVNAMFESIKDDISYSVSNRHNGAKGGRGKKSDKSEESEQPSSDSKGGSDTAEAVLAPLDDVAKGGLEVVKPPLEGCETPSEGASETAQANTIQYITVQEKETPLKGGKEKEDFSPPIVQDVVSYLNEKANTSFKPSSTNTKTLIKARYREGFTLDDFKAVIDGRVEAWAQDPKMSEYLRPQTLFGTKFESYLNASKSKPKSEKEVKLDETFAKYGKFYDEHTVYLDDLEEVEYA